MPPGVYLVDFQAISIDQYSRYAPGAGIFGDLSSMANQLGAGQAIDLLKGRGYRVIAITGKAAQAEYLCALGADEVLLRGEMTAADLVGRWPCIAWICVRKA